MTRERHDSGWKGELTEPNFRYLDADYLERLNHLSLVASLVRPTVHQVSNYLQLVSALVDLSRLQGDLAAVTSEPLRKLADHTARATATVHGLGAFARGLEGDRRPTAVGPIVTRSLARRDYELRRKQITVDVSAAAPADDAVAAPGRIVEIILLNLILNAEQALAGAADPVIEVGIERRGTEVVVTVQDNGAGVGPAVADQIFEPYFTTHADTKALGLGLTVSRGLAERHGGRLDLKPTRPDGRGARFALVLPGLRP